MTQRLIQMYDVALVESGGNIFLNPSLEKRLISYRIIRLQKESFQGEMTRIGSPLPVFFV